MSSYYIPAGWSLKKFRDLATINYGKDPSPILASDGPYPVYGTSGTERRGRDFLYDGDSVILGRKGSIDRVQLVGGKFWTIDTAYFLSDFKDALPLWLYYFLESIDLRRLNEATGVPSLSRDSLYKIEFLVPPDEEQARIAEVLATVDAAIKQSENLIAKQQRIRVGLMQDLLTRGVDKSGNVCSEATRQFRDSSIGRIPNEWKDATIRSAIELMLDYRGRTPKKLRMEWGDGDIPALSAKNVGMGQIDLSKETYYGSDALYRRWMSNGDTQEGDVVMTTEAPLGNVAQIPDRRRYILSQRVILMRGKRKELLNSFLRNCLMSSRLQDAMIVQSSGTTATGIQRRKFEQLRIPLPSLPEQERISTIIDENDRLISAGIATLEKLRREKTALKQDLLSGRRRVTALLAGSKVIAS